MLQMRHKDQSFYHLEEKSHKQTENFFSQIKGWAINDGILQCLAKIFKIQIFKLN